MDMTKPSGSIIKRSDSSNIPLVSLDNQNSNILSEYEKVTWKENMPRKKNTRQNLEKSPWRAVQKPHWQVMV